MKFGDSCIPFWQKHAKGSSFLKKWPKRYTERCLISADLQKHRSGTIIILKAAVSCIQTVACTYEDAFKSKHSGGDPMKDINLTLLTDFYELTMANGYMNSGLTKDGVHLNQKGYDIWAEAIQKYFESD